MQTTVFAFFVNGENIFSILIMIARVGAERMPKFTEHGVEQINKSCNLFAFQGIRVYNFG